jgi:beta-xylosidase
MAQAQYKSEVWSPDNGDGTYTNPVINADYSDPDVVAVGEDYYLTASSFNCIPGLPVLHSKDLVNWEIVGHALQHQFPDSIYPQHGNGVWAPSIRFHNGEYYIYWGDPDQGVFMVKTKNPAGRWDEPILVIKGQGMIDTTPLWDDDGRCYLVNGWANSRCGFNSVLTVRELSADGTQAIGDPTSSFSMAAIRTA